jgi:hypothetical protein
MEQAIRTISAEQERCMKELVELRIKLEASVLAGQVPDHLAAAVAEAVNGQESILRMLCLQGEAQQARLALPGEVVVESTGASRTVGGTNLASVSKSVADLSHQFRSLQNELLNGGGANRGRRGRRGSKIRNAFELCAGRVRSERRPTKVTETSTEAPQLKINMNAKHWVASQPQPASAPHLQPETQPQRQPEPEPEPSPPESGTIVGQDAEPPMMLQASANAALAAKEEPEPRTASMDGAADANKGRGSRGRSKTTRGRGSGRGRGRGRGSSSSSSAKYELTGEDEDDKVDAEAQQELDSMPLPGATS